MDMQLVSAQRLHELECLDMVRLPCFAPCAWMIADARQLAKEAEALLAQGRTLIMPQVSQAFLARNAMRIRSGFRKHSISHHVNRHPAGSAVTGESESPRYQLHSYR